MAISASLLANGFFTPGSGTSFNTASVSPSANKLILVFIGTSSENSGQNSAPTSVAGAGCVFTKVADYVSEVGWERQTVWCAYDASVSTGAITIAFSQSQTQLSYAIVEFTGVDGSTVDNGAAAIIQSQGVTNGGDNPTATSTASLAAFANAGNATIMYWNAATADGVPVTTTGSAGLTEMLDSHLNTGLGWDVHQSIYFQNSPNRTGVVTQSAFGSFNAKVLISMELKALGGGGTAYTIAAGVGAYTYAGNAATLSYGRKMAAALGTYSYAGVAAGLSYGRKIAADVGAYTYTGIDAALKRTYTMAAGVGSYLYAGAAAGLFNGKTMLAGVGSYLYAGVDAALKYARSMSADAGSYVYTGEDADLIYTPAPAYSYPGFQPDAFQSDAFQVEYDEVLAELEEGPDVAAFDVTSTTLASFAVTEGPDVAAFSITARTFASFHVTEGADVAAFNLNSKTIVTFGVTEGADIFSGQVLTGARLSFDLLEGPDVPNFRTFATWWDRGDAYYIYLPYESQTITIPASLTAGVTTYILVAAERQEILVPEQIDVIGIRAEDRDANLQNEWRRIDVDQERPRRRETT